MINSFKKKIVGAALISVCATGTALADADSNKVLATINGQNVTEQQVKTFFLRQGPVAGLDLKDTQAQAQLFKLFIEREILYQEAIKQGIDKLPEVAAALEEQRRQEIAKAIVEVQAKNHPITEEQVKAYYDEKYGPGKAFEFKLSHIQLASKEDAEKAIARLEKEEDFAKLATELSKDASASAGGDIGWHSPQGLPHDFGEAVKTLAPNEYTKTPVKSDLGWHVIKADEKRPIAPPPYDSVKQQIYNQLQTQAISNYINEMKQKAVIEIKQ